MRTIAETIKKLRTEKNLTIRELANELDVSYSSIGMYEQGRRQPNYETLEKIADYFNVDMNFLLGKSDIRNSYNIKKKDTKIYKALKLDYIYVPRYNNICCGNGGFSDDNVLEFVPVPSENLNDNKEYFCQYATGDSMADMIQDGDLIVFEKCSTPKLNTIGCFCVGEDESMCKKYTVVNGVPILKPLNNEYDPVIVNCEDIKCVGILKKIIKTIGDE